MKELEKIGKRFANKYIKENFDNQNDLINTYEIRQTDKELQRFILNDLNKKEDKSILFKNCLFCTYNQNDPYRKYPIYYFYKKDIEEFKEFIKDKLYTNIRLTFFKKDLDKIKKLFPNLKIYEDEENTFRIYITTYDLEFNDIIKLKELLNA